MEESLGESCIDGGKCHHECKFSCFRRECCSPFSDYKGPWKYTPAEMSTIRRDEFRSSQREQQVKAEISNYSVLDLSR